MKIYSSLSTIPKKLCAWLDSTPNRKGFQTITSEELHPNYTLTGVAKEARFEAIKASINWPVYNSPHEGLAILMEEVDELRQHVYANPKKRDLEAMRVEAIQVAAVAIRFAADLCDEKRGRR